MKRKYPKTTDYYVYVHITPDEMFYIGMSKQQPRDRWKPSQYKTHSLRPYIEKYDWDNIKHVVLKDDLTRDQAIKLEGLLIEEAKRQGFCINKNGSGGRWRDNPNKCQREYYNTEKWKEYRREWQREYSKKHRQTDEYKEYQREWQRQYRLKKKALKN